MTSNCKTVGEFRSWLREQVEFLENALRYGPCHIRPDGHVADDMYTHLVIDELVGEATRLACSFGAGHLVGDVAATARSALGLVGHLLAWVKTAPFVPPEMMTQEDLIRYLRLDVDDRDPVEHVRNLIRHQSLPVIRRGRLLLLRKTAVDAWLDVPARAKYAIDPCTANDRAGTPACPVFRPPVGRPRALAAQASIGVGRGGVSRRNPIERR